MDEHEHSAHDDNNNDGATEPPSTCSVCGTAVEDELAVLTWTLDASDGRWRWICPACSRGHVRDIEARVDRAWW